VLDDVAAVPLGNEPVLYDERIIGMTTSAAFGYRVGKPVALAFVESDVVTAGREVMVEIAGAPAPGHLVIGPAYDSDGARMRQTGAG